MTKLAVHCGKLIDMNVLSNSYPVSLIDKKVNFQSQVRGFHPQQKLAKYFIVFLCDMKTYVSQYFTFRCIYYNSASNRYKFRDSFLPSKTDLNRLFNKLWSQWRQVAA